eukprot:17617-Heterococcus_DN1.PRE.4
MHVKTHVTGRILVSFAMQDTNTNGEPALQNCCICSGVHATKERVQHEEERQCISAYKTAWHC